MRSEQLHPHITAPTDFQKGDPVVVHNPTWFAADLQNETAVVVSSQQIVPFEDDTTIDAYVVRIEKTGYDRVVYGGEIRPSSVPTPNASSAIGSGTPQRVQVRLPDGSVARGTTTVDTNQDVKFFPRDNNIVNSLHVVVLDTGETVVIPATDGISGLPSKVYTTPWGS